MSRWVLRMGLAAAAALLPMAAGPAAAEPVGDGLRGRTPALVWGYGNQGGLGLGSTAEARRPMPAALPAGTATVVAGVGFTLALTRSGALYSWGDGRFGQLGNGSTRPVLVKPVRVAVPGGRRVVAVDAAGGHAVALTSDGQAWAWGRNNAGQLGDGTRTDRSRPVRVRTPGGARVVAVAAGTDHALAVTTAGSVLAWGANRAGQLGRGLGSAQPIPLAVPLPGRSPARTVAAGEGHSLALLRDGRVVTFGTPTGTAAALKVTPRNAAPRIVPIPGGRARAIDAGIGHSVAVTPFGDVYAWGDNSRGQLGDGTRTDRTTAVRAKVRTVALIATAGYHSIAVDVKGQVWTWGDNTHGQNGDGTVETSTAPERLTALSRLGVKAVAVGEFHSLAVVTRLPANPGTPPRASAPPAPGKRPQPPGGAAAAPAPGAAPGHGAAARPAPAAAAGAQPESPGLVRAASTGTGRSLLIVALLAVAGCAGLLVRRRRVRPAAAAAAADPTPASGQEGN
jgi:alpha-tubulin suppressor-like RCC1 family protein